MNQRLRKVYRKAQCFSHWLYLLSILVLAITGKYTFLGYLVIAGLFAITPLVSRILALPFALLFLPFCGKEDKKSTGGSSGGGTTYHKGVAIGGTSSGRSPSYDSSDWNNHA